MSTKTFKDLGHEVLDMRTEDAVRSVLSERLRFRKHLASSSIGHIPVAEIQPRHIALLTREMVRKDADDFRGRRKISRVTVQKVMQLASAVFDVAVEPLPRGPEGQDAAFCRGKVDGPDQRRDTEYRDMRRYPAFVQGHDPVRCRHRTAPRRTVEPGGS